MLCQLLQAYCHPKCFKDIKIYSQSMGNDPVMLTFMNNRHPEVDVTLEAAPNMPFLRELAARVRDEYAEYNQLAQVGRFKKPSKKESLLARQMKEFDDVDHPYTSSSGIHHGRDLHLPFLNNNAMEHLDPLTQLFYKKVQSGLMPSPCPVGPSSMISTQRLKFGHMKRMLNNSELSKHNDPMWRKFAPLVYEKDDPEIPHNTDVMTTAHHALMLNLNHPDLRSVQIAQQRTTEAKIHPAEYKLKKEKSGTLLVFDDCGWMFHTGTGSREIERFMTMIRHSHCGAIFLFQQTSSIPRIMRTIATDLFIFRLQNTHEVRFLMEEFGGAISDFDGKYYAATKEVEGRDRDFMWVDIMKDKAYRAFTGEIIGVGEQKEEEPVDGCTAHSSNAVPELKPKKKCNPRKKSNNNIKKRN